VARSPVGVRRVGRHHLPDYKPVEQHTDVGQILLDGGSRTLALQQFDVCGDMHGLHALQLADSLPFTPAREIGSGPRIAARVFLLRMLTVKYSRKRSTPLLPIRPINAGTPICGDEGPS